MTIFPSPTVKLHANKQTYIALPLLLMHCDTHTHTLSLSHYTMMIRTSFPSYVDYVRTLSCLVDLPNRISPK